MACLTNLQRYRGRFSFKFNIMYWKIVWPGAVAFQANNLLASRP